MVTGSWRPHDQLQLWESVRPSRARIVALRSALARLSTVSAPRVQCTVGQSASRSFGRIQFHLCVGTYWSARTRSAPFARSSLCARCRGSLSATLRACCTQRRIPWPRRLCRACVDINRSNPAKQQQQRAHGPKLSSSWARAWVGACARVVGFGFASVPPGAHCIRQRQVRVTAFEDDADREVLSGGRLGGKRDANV